MVTNMFALKTDGCEIHLQLSEDFKDAGTIGYLTMIRTGEDVPESQIVGLDEDDLRVLAANFLAFANIAKSKKLEQ